MVLRAFLWMFGWALLQALTAGSVQAAPIDLRRDMCVETIAADAGSPAASPHDIAAGCRPARTAPRRGWTWLTLDDPARLKTLPAGWRLLVDQSRYARIAVVAVARDGTRQTIRVDAGDLQRHWAPGGLFQFGIDRPGKDVRALHLGFEGLDTLSLMRKVTALSPGEAERQRDAWYLLFGLFCGAIISAFTYNLVIYTGHRYPFQRWYLIWAGLALLYGLSWTNMAAILWPRFVGPDAVRADMLLVGLLIAAGDMFFLTVLEQGILPRPIRGLIMASAAASATLGLAEAMDGLFPAGTTDALFNDAAAAGTVAVVLGAGIAIRRGSRVIWFYLAGWTPVLSIFVLRLLRNFGVLPQDDLVDMATFGTLAVESIILSLAIADRFRLLRQERDSARQARAIGDAEAAGHRRAAMTDFLTGLGNRAAFQAAMQEMQETQDRRPSGIDDGFVLFLIDVDHLKDVNDRYGHEGGDALLCFVASSLAALAALAGPGATLHRIGGDEFALILSAPTIDDMTAWCAALDGLQGCPWTHRGHRGSLSLSLGSAHFPTDADDGQALFGNADLALYAAKRGGRRRHERYGPSMRQATERARILVHEAHQSLREGRFLLHFQPLVDIADGAGIGHEALLRWDHPIHGLIGPDLFADILVDDEVGLLIQRHVLDLALDHLARGAQDSGFLSVNFTGAQLRGREAALAILDGLQARGIARGRLCVEVTEGVILERASTEITEALHALHAAGVRIALDDFGTGYASLVHLQQLPADTLKIDRTFVANLGRDAGEAEAIIRAIVNLAAGLGKTVVAEGIETHEQRRALLRLGCRFGQGYFFGRPAPLGERAPPKLAGRADTVRAAA